MIIPWLKTYRSRMVFIALLLTIFFVCGKALAIENQEVSSQKEGQKDVVQDAKVEDPFKKNRDHKKEGEYFQADKNSSLLSLYFNNIPVQNLLELLAEFKGVNLVISDTVSGNMSIHLSDVTWEQALDAILTMENLALRTKGKIFFVTSAAERGEQKQDNAYHGAEVTSEIFQVHYADAVTLADLVKASGDFLSERGNIVADARTNTLWIKDVSEQLNKLKKFLQGVDTPAKQVRIKAHIVNVEQGSMKELGLKFGTIASGAADDLHMDMPLSVTDTGHFSVAIAKIANDTLLNLELTALEREGRARVISNPELITGDRQTASIESGQEVPYQENTSSGATNTVFKKAVLSLEVMPVITSGDKILLNLSVNQDKVSSLVVNGVPAISTQKVHTQVLLNNGETAVLGGIYEETSSHTNERVPVLGAIPFVGALFRSKASQAERRELLIFVRPEIM